jgi:Tol biopolymer transport system component
VNPTTGVNAIFKSEYAAESNDADDTDINGNWLATCDQGKVGEPTQNWPCMTDFVCAGKQQVNTHSRGMCQRGSQRWATGIDNTQKSDSQLPILNSNGDPITRRDWRCILDHYYNASSNNVTVDPNYSGVGSVSVGTAGTGNRTAFLQGAPVFGNIAYEDDQSSPNISIRAASASDGSGDQLLTSNGQYPSWEPGGKRLAYFGPGYGISVINADGTSPHQITAPSGWDPYGYPIVDFAPSWSPLGDKIAFCSNRSGSDYDIWTVNPDGSDLQQITNNAFIYWISGPEYEDGACYIRWSPDGTKLTFTGDAGYDQQSDLGNWQVYTTPSTPNSPITKLTNCVINNPNYQNACDTPSWSPSGTKIVFSDEDYVFGDAMGGGGIYTMNPDGTGIAPVFQSNTTINLFPQWSTDGSKIFFTSNQPTEAGYGVWSVNPDGTNLTEIIGGGKGFKYSPWGIDCSRCQRFDQ